MEAFAAVNSPCDPDGARDLAHASTRRCELSHVGSILAADANPREMTTMDDVEPEEAALLSSLVETLVEDWYIVRFNRRERLGAIVAMAEEKEGARNGEPGVSNCVPESETHGDE